MNLIEKLQAENEALKSKITSLEKLNTWYLEQLKLRQKEKFGSSSEKAEENQLSLSDVFSDLFRLYVKCWGARCHAPAPTLT